jgi:two-component system, NarL family, response regulator DesR
MYPVRTYGSGVARANGIEPLTLAQNCGVGVESLALESVAPAASAETTVLVAVESALLREALVAALGALDGFRVVAEAANDDQALELARKARPQLALIDQELSGDSGPWAIHCMRSEQLASVIVAIGRGADGNQAKLAGACEYVQIGAPPRDLLRAVRAAISNY